MMKWIYMVLALALSSCSGSKTMYYRLPSTGNLIVATSHGVFRPIWVEHVAVPEYLAGNGVVYQRNDVQLVIASNNQWVSPLDQQLLQTLISNLSASLPGALVSATPLGKIYDTLNITVTGFHWRYDGYAIVSGTWVLQHGDNVIKQPFSIDLPLKEDGYDALVRTMAKGWQRVAEQIANVIIHQA